MQREIFTKFSATLYALLIILLVCVGVEANAMDILNKILTRELTVGTDVSLSDVFDFYYTYDTSTNPPHYQRYRFYIDGKKYMFYHETRAGNTCPLREKHITVSGSKELSEEEWLKFWNYIKGGTVKNREEHLESGASGPWLFLYWKGDHSRCQEFSFATLSDRHAFEEFCLKLETSK